VVWFKIDDNFWSHPKTLQLSDGAQALWVRAGSWSMSHLTDGFIPDYALPVLSAKPRFADELRMVSLWKKVEGGNQFHDWGQYQPTREQIEADRLAAADRKRKSREKSQGQSRVTGAETPPDAAPSPTRPDPTRPSSSTKKSETPASRGSRISPSFALTEEMRAWGKENTPLVNLDTKLPEFIDYWTAVAGEKGVKLDWVSTWRNGMRKQQEFAARDAPAVSTTPKKRFVAHAD